MIAKLQGKVADTFQNFLIIEVSGVGYRVEGLVHKYLDGQELTVYIYQHYRQDEVRLFGFEERDDLVIFEELLTVSGVGPKAAISLLQNVGRYNILMAVKQQDESLLKAPGVGQKTAQRILIDLKNKLDKLDLKIDASKIGIPNTLQDDEVFTDLISALIDLGYKSVQIKQAIKDAQINIEDDIQINLKKVLSYLSKK